MPRFISAIFLCAALAPFSARAVSALEIRGIALGDTLAEVQATHADAECRPDDGLLADTMCMISGYGDAPNALVMIYLVGGAVESVSVSFDQKHFAVIANAMRTKYGEPVEDEVQERQNAMGATFASRKISWFVPGEGIALTLTEREGRIDRSGVQLRSRAGLQAFGARHRAKSVDSIDNL